MNDFVEGANATGALVAILLIIIGIPIGMGLLFKLFVSMWGL